MTLSINGTQRNNALSLCWVSRTIYYYYECHYAECIMLYVIMLSVVSPLPVTEDNFGGVDKTSIRRNGVAPRTLDCQRRMVGRWNVKPGNSNWKGKLSTVDLLIKVACFLKQSTMFAICRLRSWFILIIIVATFKALAFPKKGLWKYRKYLKGFMRKILSLRICLISFPEICTADVTIMFKEVNCTGPSSTSVRLPW